MESKQRPCKDKNLHLISLNSHESNSYFERSFEKSKKKHHFSAHNALAAKLTSIRTLQKKRKRKEPPELDFCWRKAGPRFLGNTLKRTLFAWQTCGPVCFLILMGSQQVNQVGSPHWLLRLLFLSLQSHDRLLLPPNSTHLNSTPSIIDNPTHSTQLISPQLKSTQVNSSHSDWQSLNKVNSPQLTST